MLAKEMKLLNLEEEDGSLNIQSQTDDVTCSCCFYRKWQLPCRHFMKLHLQYGKILTDHYWDSWQYKWEESGFNIYKKSESYNVEKTAGIDIGVPMQLKLEMRELYDRLMTQFYMLGDGTAHWPLEIRHQLFRRFLDDVNISTRRVSNMAVCQLLDQLPQCTQQVQRQV
jgi:hypothetical protein